MRKTQIIKSIEVKQKPSYLTEAALVLENYLVWKDKSKLSNISFYDMTYFTNDEGKIIFSYLVDKYPHMEDYVDFIMEVRKEAKPYLDEFFLDKNEDLEVLHRIHRYDNQSEFSFLLTLLTTFGLDSFEEISKEDFKFQSKLVFLMFVDVSVLEPYTNVDLSRSMMIKEFNNLDLLALMLKTTYTADESMALFKFLYNLEDIFDRLKGLFTKLEPIIEKNYPLIEERYVNKIKAYVASDFEFAYKLLGDVGFNDMKLEKSFDAIFRINLFNPNSTAFRLLYLTSKKLELVFGLTIDEFYGKGRDKYSDSLNQDRLRAFSDPTRFEIIKLLQKKSYYVKEMADILYLTPATLSYHLNQLQTAGFIGIYYKGRKSYYYLRKDTLTKLGDYLYYFAQNINERGRNETN
ncbi:MAG: metalloregulator ArsR/SmtB family transcription factor [Peptoniphilaceae bacterium]|nr:metalloregulator ArsR/SmtB family transcription factor [Peptoniphilaceae bacterium]MDY6019038.1 metalloregulator ArsR/SmtB family transcription factor [Anaerococcus sp.]